MREELSTIILILWSPSAAAATAALSYHLQVEQRDEMNCPGNSLAERGTELDLGLCDQQCQARALRSPTEGWHWIKVPLRLWHQCAVGPGTHCLSSLRRHFPICKQEGGTTSSLTPCCRVFCLSLRAHRWDTECQRGWCTTHSSKHFTCTASFFPSK